MAGPLHFEATEDAQEIAIDGLWTYDNERPEMGIGGVTPAQRLCCTNPFGDSSRESSMVAGLHGQTCSPDLQDQELAGLQ